MTKLKTLQVKIADVPLEQKLDVIGAAIAAVREAHRDEMAPHSWAALNIAQEKISEAMLSITAERRHPIYAQENNH